MCALQSYISISPHPLLLSLLPVWFWRFTEQCDRRPTVSAAFDDLGDIPSVLHAASVRGDDRVAANVPVRQQPLWGPGDADARVVTADLEFLSAQVGRVVL